VGWQPEDGSFELAAHTGETWIEGPGLDGARSVRGGERLLVVGDGGERAPTPEASLVADEVAVIEEHRVDRAADGALPLPARSHHRSRRQRHAAAPQPVLEPTRESDATWHTLARKGSYAEAIVAAQAAGFSDLCAALDAEALLELADTARYAGRTSLAREALQALRDRFPGTDAAAAAAFDFGRLAPANADGCEDAAHWLRIHLDERPDGPLSEAARRRLDECTTPSPTQEPSR
jgi:hypothetical protein